MSMTMCTQVSSIVIKISRAWNSMFSLVRVRDKWSFSIKYDNDIDNVDIDTCMFFI